MPPIPMALAETIAQRLRSAFVRHTEPRNHLGAGASGHRISAHERQRHAAPDAARIVESHLIAQPRPPRRIKRLFCRPDGLGTPDNTGYQDGDGHVDYDEALAPHGAKDWHEGDRTHFSMRSPPLPSAFRMTAWLASPHVTRIPMAVAVTRAERA
ncbi:hypothetical protein METUNv1_02181 [Methyloversatilis universalis FAM5]|uniref:Uncharacterized protein n=1 Tax=Methyloversatilis universalis (strain ATCC BAA-1314 / DSM 25237 / JCM 13912 / CCUG 52030 / FAM5) TaxID=1000565 RepID=F5RD23_METUF|nr:hypothetical protein METUNv1_02181 [Methyloversatilis universalis FAM5]